MKTAHPVTPFVLPVMFMLIGLVPYVVFEGRPPVAYGLPGGALFGWGFVATLLRVWNALQERR